METKINTKAKKEIILIFFSIFFISLVYALTPPPLPDHFIGNVLIDEQNASIGTQIEVYVLETLELTYNVTEEGKYDLYVATGETGNSIGFKISDISAGSSTRQGGETIPLDLSISTITTTPPSSGSSGGGSGGGGGGGSGSSGSSSGGGGFISPPPTTGTSESNSGENVTQKENQETEEQGKTSSGITGAVVGFLDSGKGIIAIVFVIVLGIGVMLIKFKPLKWIKRFSR